jgi:hypothetical protein
MARWWLFGLATGVPFGRGCLVERHDLLGAKAFLEASNFLDYLASFGKFAVLPQLRSGFAFALFLIHSPASSSLRGSPDGAMVALHSGDRRAIREGVLGRAPRPPRCRGFSGSLEFPRLFGFVW